MRALPLDPDASRAFDADPEAVTLFLDGRVAAVNRAAQELYRCTEEAALTRSPQDWSPELQPDGVRSDDHVARRIAQVLQGNPQVFAWRHRRWDGSEFDAEVSVSSVLIGGLRYLRSVVRDLSPRTVAMVAPSPAGRTAGHFVLVVDDEELVLRVAQRALERAGYRVVTARDGVEGVALFEIYADRFGLVILDVMMPRMTGFEAYALITRCRPEMPVLLTTGHAEMAPPPVVSAPMLHKPYTVNALTAAAWALFPIPATPANS